MALPPTAVIGVLWVEFQNQEKTIMERNLPSHYTIHQIAVAYFTHSLVFLCISHGFLYLVSVCIQNDPALQTTTTTRALFVVHITDWGYVQMYVQLMLQGVH